MASEVRAVCTTSSPSPGNPEAGTLPTVTVGGITYRLPFADLLPALLDDDLSALRGDIRERGIVVPIVIDEHHNVIDGANRLGSPPSSASATSARTSGRGSPMPRRRNSPRTSICTAGISRVSSCAR